MSLVGCSQLSPDFGNVYSISIQGTLVPQVEQGDTLTLKGLALDAGGTALSGTPVIWSVLDTGAIGLVLDSLTGTITAVSPDTVNVQGHVGTLRSDPLRVIVTPLPDTISTSLPRVIVPFGTVESGGLLTHVQGISSLSTLQVVGGKKVTYVIVSPAAVPGIYLEAHTVLSDTLPGPDPTRVTGVSSGTGDAAVYVHRVAGQTPPDSAIVEATGLTARGATVKGSPVRFTVVFLTS